MTDEPVNEPTLGPGEHPCTVCGAAYAPFGHGPPGVSPTREPERFRWFCRECRPPEPAPDTSLQAARKEGPAP